MFAQNLPAVYRGPWAFQILLFQILCYQTKCSCLQNKPPKWWGNKKEEDMKADIEKRKEAQNSDMRFKYVDDSDTDISEDEEDA